ncbi:hypothetical protein [Alkalithermobacter paradoxus]|uniref:Uncharacterized protein n=1 Tax=Alkalithermobacter paradoxus TaxID=29349 RepID=A0A1V4I6I5_9FIRM|nr:hypothetical protein CLOTH_13570 [[Clostridium] thermoalcaliphilum]
MGRLERTLQRKKDKKFKKIGFVVSIFIFLVLVVGITIIDYRTGNFLGIYDRPLFMKIYDFTKGLSYQLR